MQGRSGRRLMLVLAFLVAFGVLPAIAEPLLVSPVEAQVGPPGGPPEEPVDPGGDEDTPVDPDPITAAESEPGPGADPYVGPNPAELWVDSLESEFGEVSDVRLCSTSIANAYTDDCP